MAPIQTHHSNNVTVRSQHWLHRSGRRWKFFSHLSTGSNRNRKSPTKSQLLKHGGLSKRTARMGFGYRSGVNYRVEILLQVVNSNKFELRAMFMALSATSSCNSIDSMALVKHLHRKDIQTLPLPFVSVCYKAFSRAFGPSASLGDLESVAIWFRSATCCLQGPKKVCSPTTWHV